MQSTKLSKMAIFILLLVVIVIFPGCAGGGLINNSPVIYSLIADSSNIEVNQDTTITCYATDQDGDALTYTLLASVPIQMGAESAYSRFYDYDPDLTPSIPSKYYAFSAWTDEGESSINIEGRVTPLNKFILVSPSNGATGVGTTPTFTWQSVANAHEYNIQVYRKDNYGWYDSVWYRWDIPAGTTSITYGEGGYYAAEPLNSGDECVWIIYAHGYNYTAVSLSYPRTFKP